MIESVLHFFKIHRKVIPGNPPVIVQNMLRITPKTLNAVDMVLAAIRDFLAQLFERLLFSTGLVPAPHIAALRLIHLKRTAENTLSAPQKVGRTVENVLSASNHEGILTLDGYESH